MVGHSIFMLFLFYLFSNACLRSQFAEQKKGLSDNTAHRAFFDSRGYTWILTNSGLNRYDGKSVKIFKSGTDSTSLSGDFVKHMAEDAQGNLWCTVESHGFCRYDPRTETFKLNYSTPDSNSYAYQLEGVDGDWRQTDQEKSKVTRGTTFKITLPVHREAPQQEPILESVPIVSPTLIVSETDLADANSIDDQRPQLLIIEDHPDVVQYLKACLDKHYAFHVARNGVEGLEMAKALIPDIIISDVMMPKMDGFEVCENLKTDSKTSHIPVLLLTAKATIEDRIEGLSHGADAYLIKPFNIKELLVRMEQLIALRKQLQERYSGTQFLNDLKVTSNEKDFLSQLIEIIHAHISDEDFQTPNEFTNQLN